MGATPRARWSASGCRIGGFLLLLQLLGIGFEPCHLPLQRSQPLAGLLLVEGGLVAQGRQPSGAALETMDGLDPLLVSRGELARLVEPLVTRLGQLLDRGVRRLDLVLDAVVLGPCVDHAAGTEHGLARGRSNADIAAALFIAPKTVKNHINHIYARLGVDTQLDDGRTKIDVAKQALRDVVAELPDEGLDVALRVYGHRVGNAEELQQQGCRDTELIVPPGPVDRDQLDQAIGRFSPSGYTPIGRSLRHAADDLAAYPDARPTIVLVSDGIDTCAPPAACDVARQLADEDVEVVVQTIGFAVDDAARRQLSCIAEATGGTYRDAPDADSLTDSLRALALRAYRTYQPMGDPVTGAAQLPQAPLLEPGRHIDTIGDSERRYWAVDVAPGETLTVAAQLVTGPDKPAFGAGFAGGLLAPDTTDTQPDPALGCDSYIDVLEFLDTLQAGATGARITAEPDGTGCSAPGRWTFGAELDRLNGDELDEIGIELIVAVEGAAAEPSMTPTPSMTPSPTTTAAPPSPPGASPPAAGQPQRAGGGGLLVTVVAAAVALLVGAGAGWTLARPRR